jgi:hypothetical protein
MPWKLRSRRSFKVAPGVRFNVTKRGVGASVGNKWFRKSVHSSGRSTTTVSPVPGVLSHVTSSTSTRPRRPAPSQQVQATRGGCLLAGMMKWLLIGFGVLLVCAVIAQALQ